MSYLRDFADIVVPSLVPFYGFKLADLDENIDESL